MKKKWTIIHAFLLLLASENLYATANSPIQRIDVTNLLWNNVVGGNGGSTKVSVIVDFENGGSVPCFTTTLPFQKVITVWAGVGQACIAAITSINITPLDSPIGIGTVYLAPPVIQVNSSLYLTQLTVFQNTAPLFDPGNGQLISTGTAQTSSVSHLAYGGSFY